MKTISIKDIIHQLYKDLIGKDVYRGTTQTYTLLANQFGHFALGFIPATIIYNLMIYAGCKYAITSLPWVGVSLGWFIFPPWLVFPTP